MLRSKVWMSKKVLKNLLIFVIFRHMVLSLEESERSSKSVILALRDQVSYFKKKSKEVEKLKEETNQLKETLSSMDKVESVLHGSKADVEEILRNERSMSTLALLSVSLKKYITLFV